MGQIITDQAGRFSIPSKTGNIQLVYDHGSNYIPHAEPMKTKSRPEILAAYQHIHTLFCNAASLRPQLQHLGNECSAPLKQQCMASKHINCQLVVPPHVHRRNAAEQAIRNFKNHLIAGLCSTNKDFPLHLRDHLLLQAILSLSISWAACNSIQDFCQLGPK
jgi:hypothetical protein